MVRPILPKQEERESPGLDSVEPVRIAKRRCISSACIPCRRRKSKCDGAIPACSTCKAVYRMECVYDADGDRRRRSATDKDRKTDSLDHLVTRIRTAPENEVETILDQLRTTGTFDTTTATSPFSGGVKNEKRKASDDTTSHESERIIVQDMGKLQIDELGDVRHFGHSSSLESIHSWPRRMSFSTGEKITTGPLWTTVTTDNELISELLNLYFTWHHPVHVLFSKSCFLSDMKRHRAKYCSPLLVNAVLALACHYSRRADACSDPTNPSTAGNHFFAEARRLLVAEEGRSSLTVAQALALMALREAGCGRDSTSWMYCGRSLHVALDLGLHLPAKLEANALFSPTEMEVRKITFWGLFVLDKLWSMHFGRIPQLPTSVVGIPKPSIIQQLEAEAWTSPDRSTRPCHIMEVAIQYAELAEVLGDALCALHSPKQQFDTAMLEEFYSRLMNWRKKIPKYMDPQEDTVPAVFVLHMFYQSIILLIFRPFRDLMLAAFPETPRHISIAAAIEICTVFSYYQNMGYDSHPLGLIPHVLLSAALVFLQENIDETVSLQQAMSSSSLAYNLEQCVLNLRKMSTTWELSSQTLHVIWSRATSMDLPQRVKKALYPETISSLAMLPAAGLLPFCEGEPQGCDGLLAELEMEQQQSIAVGGLECLGFDTGIGSDAWVKADPAAVAANKDDLKMAASVASLLAEPAEEGGLGIEGWEEAFR